MLTKILPFFKGKNDNEKEIVNIEKTTSTIHFSNKKYEPVTITEGEHTITIIYRDKEDTFVWICPNCETENLSSRSECQVCKTTKERGA